MENGGKIMGKPLEKNNEEEWWNETFFGILTVLPTCFDVEFSHTGQILPNETANNMRSPALTPMADLQQTQMGNSQRETVFHGDSAILLGHEKPQICGMKYYQCHGFVLEMGNKKNSF